MSSMVGWRGDRGSGSEEVEGVDCSAVDHTTT